MVCRRFRVYLHYTTQHNANTHKLLQYYRYNFHITNKFCLHIVIQGRSYVHFRCHDPIFVHTTTPCLKKTVQICFCHNFVKFPPIWIIFGRKMVKRLKLYQMDSFSISPNSRHHTTMLNADVQNCYITLKVVICNNLSDDLISKNKQKCGLFSWIISSYNSSVQNC